MTLLVREKIIATSKFWFLAQSFAFLTKFETEKSDSRIKNIYLTKKKLIYTNKNL